MSGCISFFPSQYLMIGKPCGGFVNKREKTTLLEKSFECSKKINCPSRKLGNPNIFVFFNGTGL